jgi:hypothetical protein
MIRRVALILVTLFLAGCTTIPASYTPTTGKVGSQKGRACVLKLLGIIPFGNEETLLDRALDAAGNPTKDVAVLYHTAFYYILTNQCVIVKGSP